MLARLIERAGGRPGRVFPLRPSVTTIGRSEDNDLIVAGDYISSHHAEVRREGTAYVLRDRDSKNGTRLNGQPVHTPQVLQSGDRIELPGPPGVTLLFDVGAGTAELPLQDAPAAGTRLDTIAAELWVRGEHVHVTAKEYRALSLLFERAGALVSKEELAMGVWPEYAGQVADANIEQLIARLRRKLGSDQGQPPVLRTVRGLGYRLVLS